MIHCVITKSPSKSRKTKTDRQKKTILKWIYSINIDYTYISNKNAWLPIKSDMVQFNGLNDTIDLDAHPGGILAWTDFFM